MNNPPEGNPCEQGGLLSEGGVLELVARIWPLLELKFNRDTDKFLVAVLDEVSTHLNHDLYALMLMKKCVCVCVDAALLCE